MVPEGLVALKPLDNNPRKGTSPCYSVTMAFCGAHVSRYPVVKGFPPPDFLNNALIRVRLLLYSGAPAPNMSIGPLECSTTTSGPSPWCHSLHSLNLVCNINTKASIVDVTGSRNRQSCMAFRRQPRAYRSPHNIPRYMWSFSASRIFLVSNP